ncbi:MAG: alpha/beta hydrolase [Rhodocyclaceae bacterium]|nr:alpha/beta hydrolase [Rhodocyclaceae bacterium]
MYAFRHSSLSVAAGTVWLDAMLAHAPDARGIAVLVQNGCILHADLRDAVIAKRLQDGHFATLSVDLLTRYEEQRDVDARYNVPLMSARLDAVLEWLDHQPGFDRLAVALVASGTACGAAVRAAARRPQRVGALVCRGGRPDLAGAAPLRSLGCPVRFITGGVDAGAPRFQRPAFELVTAPRDWQSIDQADSDFRAPGSLDNAARLTLEWVAGHLPPPKPPEDPETAPAATADRNAVGEQPQ